MKDEKIRKAINAWGKENEVEVKILDNHAYDHSIIGITEDGRLVYDYEKMIQELINDEAWDEDEATEWVDYNTMRALPYMGENKPIVINCTIENMVFQYGENK